MLEREIPKPHDTTLEQLLQLTKPFPEEVALSELNCKFAFTEPDT